MATHGPGQGHPATSGWFIALAVGEELPGRARRYVSERRFVVGFSPSFRIPDVRKLPGSARHYVSVRRFVVVLLIIHPHW
jgi:hypothetical protein